MADIQTGEVLDQEGLYQRKLNVASIELKGEPYEQVVNGEPISCTETLENLALDSDYEKRLEANIGSYYDTELRPMRELGFHGLDALIKTPGSLSYDDAFSVGTYVSMASNELLRKKLAPEVAGFREGLLEPDVLMLHSVSLLQNMSTREGLVGLSAEEIAGLIAATLEIDTVCRVNSYDNDQGPIFGMGGMGGDRGIQVHGGRTKIFNSSTIAALGLASFGEIHKHHSYPNTSKVGGQLAIEMFGARSDFNTVEHLRRVINDSGILMSSCHNTRTLHAISHRLKGETINHVIGPGAIPHAAHQMISALIGVNHNVHPETFMSALGILQRMEVQNYGSSVAFCAIDSSISDIPDEIMDTSIYYASPSLKSYVALDEVAPPPFTTMASFLVGGDVHTTLISPEDFMDEQMLRTMDFEHLKIPNEVEEIRAANNDVINGNNDTRCAYLAMSMALGLFARNFSHLPEAFEGSTGRVNAEYLRNCHSEALEVVQSGKLRYNLKRYVAATNNRTTI